MLLATTLIKMSNGDKITENKDFVKKRKATSVIWNYVEHKQEDIEIIW